MVAYTTNTGTGVAFATGFHRTAPVLELRVARTTSDYDPDALLGETAADMLVHGEQLGEKPVVVLSAGAADSDAFPDPARARFTALHAQMAAVLSTKGEHRVIAGADHYTIVTQPDYAHRVAAAIQDVISSSTPEEP